MCRMRFVVLALAALLVAAAVAFAQDPAPPPEPAPTPTPTPTARRRTRRPRRRPRPWCPASRPTSARSRGASPRRSAAPRAKGRLKNGVLLPELGEDFFTWDPIRNEIPNREWRRWGTDRLIRTVLKVLHEYRTEFDGAQRVGIMDLSRPKGGAFGKNYGGLGHASHQNGLDIDILYPRKDGTETRPTKPSRGRSQARPGARRPLRRGRRGEGLRRPAAEPQGPEEGRDAADLPRRPPARPDPLTGLRRAPRRRCSWAARSSTRRRSCRSRVDAAERGPPLARARAHGAAPRRLREPPRAPAA